MRPIGCQECYFSPCRRCTGIWFSDEETEPKKGGLVSTGQKADFLPSCSKVEISTCCFSIVLKVFIQKVCSYLFHWSFFATLLELGERLVLSFLHGRRPFHKGLVTPPLCPGLFVQWSLCTKRMREWNLASVLPTLLEAQTQVVYLEKGNLFSDGAKAEPGSSALYARPRAPEPWWGLFFRDALFLIVLHWLSGIFMISATLLFSANYTIFCLIAQDGNVV